MRTKLIFPDVYAYICILVDCINRFSIERGVGLFIITFSHFHFGIEVNARVNIAIWISVLISGR